MSSPDLKPEQLFAINKLKDAIEQYLDITTIVEPNNAMSAIEVRMMVTGAQKISQLPKPDWAEPYVPYEWVLPVVVSVRTTGGNAQNVLSGQAAWINLQLSNFLENELYEIKKVTQVIKVPRGMTRLGPKNSIRIVGDAEIVEPKFLNSGFSGDKQTNDYDTFDGPFTYREDWSIKMVLTLHRDFDSPELRELRFYNEAFDEEIVISKQEESTR